MASNIVGLSAGLLEHQRWPVSKWFYANPLWYYHRDGTDEEIVPNRKFYQLVDPDLREICRELNDAGLHTTPSCQGHFYPRERFERIWDELKREEPQIVGSGLVVKDSETDAEYLFRDPSYRVPWANFDGFYAKAADHQGTGYLGIVVPCDNGLCDRFRAARRRTGKMALFEENPHGRRLGGTLFDILVEPRDPENRAKIWAEIHRVVHDVLTSSSPSPGNPGDGRSEGLRELQIADCKSQIAN
jgi:hypothetical protein